MDAAVRTANAKMVWNRTKGVELIDSANQLSAGVHTFHGLLRIESELRSWRKRQLGPAADLGSQVIQKGKDTAPHVATGAALLAVVAIAGKKFLGEGTAES